jgi:hypothetical protein
MPEITSATIHRRQAQSRHAVAVRWSKPDQDDTARDLAVARIVEFAERVLASTPPLDPARRARAAAAILAGGAR